MDFQDRPIQCVDCRNEFIFTAGEQEFYERKGFREVPKRCKPCRDQRKAKRVDGGARDGGRDPYPTRDPHAQPARSDRDGNGHRADGNRGPREMFDAVCASCGAPARVPFRPANGRPVYCRECYSSRQGQGSGYGGGY